VASGTDAAGERHRRMEETMTLTPERIAMVRQTFHDLAPEKEMASQRFYELLFEIAPDLRALFRGDIESQGMRFMTTLGLILDDIDNPVALRPHMERLAKGHAALGVKPEHFIPMGEALVRTMEEVLDERFPPGARAAWEDAYAHIADQMIALARE
jgi:nitric oxide dioxygenase